ncbi:MAG TPA: PHB depolymerase family esterase [Chloroflexia bacterium]|nr:PHB depolymerase family esterase [Chloroflexia bacterium]
MNHFLKAHKPSIPVAIPGAACILALLLLAGALSSAGRHGTAVAAPLTDSPTFGVVQAGSFITETYGDRDYRLYIPEGYQAGTPLPLLVVLHGCGQDPTSMSVDTHFNVYADQFQFLALYPRQPQSANGTRCWNWFEPAHQQRGAGEPALIAGMTAQVQSRYSVDSTRIFATGLSAGGAMSIIMGATYPDVYAAIGVSAGIEYGCATDTASGLVAMASGGCADPVESGNKAYAAMGQYKRVVPVIVFHGSADAVVVVKNAHNILTQWAQTDDLAADGADNNDIDDVPEGTSPGQVPGGHTYTRYTYNDSRDGRTVLEKYIVDAMPHAWSGGTLDPANGGDRNVDPLGPDASLIMWQFFQANPMPGNEPMPTATAIPCAVQFPDVPQGSAFYAYVRCLACQGILGGFADGTFKPGSNVTRGQLSKIVANAAGFNEQVGGQTFEDVPPGSTYHPFIERMAARHIIGGYPCGGPGEACGEGDRPYFRPNASASRGQIAKIVSDAAGYAESPGAQRFEDVAPGSAFYEGVQRLASRGHVSGYECGGASEPCGEGNRPYFRPGDDASRGQTAKIVANTFFPGCETSTQGMPH